MAPESLKNEIAAAAEGAKHDPQLLGPGADRPRLIVLPVTAIQKDPNQPRRDVGDLSEMIASITVHGILQPIVVSPAGEDGYLLLMGERRFEAAKAAGLKSIPCIVRTIDEHRRLEVQLIENLHRKAFTPVEEARAYQKLIEEFRYRHEDLASVLGRSRSAITQTLTILRLPPAMLAKAESQPDISSSVLLEVAKEDDPDLQARLFEAAQRGEATVKSLRAVKAAAHRKPTAGSTVSFPPVEGITISARVAEGEMSWQAILQALEVAVVHARNRKGVE